jgi:hypothetical protein
MAKWGIYLAAQMVTFSGGSRQEVVICLAGYLASILLSPLWGFW